MLHNTRRDAPSAAAPPANEPTRYVAGGNAGGAGGAGTMGGGTVGGSDWDGGSDGGGAEGGVQLRPRFDVHPLPMAGTAKQPNALSLSVESQNMEDALHCACVSWHAAPRSIVNKPSSVGIAPESLFPNVISPKF
eukprot:6287938-Prymnesium_polylepis.1